MFCRSLFVLLYFFIWPSLCLSFDLRILITPLMSANYSYLWWGLLDTTSCDQVYHGVVESRCVIIANAITSTDKTNKKWNTNVLWNLTASCHSYCSVKGSVLETFPKNNMTENLLRYLSKFEFKHLTLQVIKHKPLK